MLGKVLISLIFIFLFVEVGIIFLPYTLFDSSVSPQQNKQIHYVAVLFHGYNKEENGVDSETQRRLNYAISMVRDKQNQILLLVGGNSPQYERTGANLMSEYCQKRGIPEKYIITDSTSFDSNSNLKSIIDISDSEPKGRVAVVSSFFHLLRIKYTQISLKNRFIFAPYHFETSCPKISRYDFWKSIHYNVLLFILKKLTPNTIYDNIVIWIRSNTKH